jgi:hypothetical protein
MIELLNQQAQYSYDHGFWLSQVSKLASPCGRKCWHPLLSSPISPAPYHCGSGVSTALFLVHVRRGVRTNVPLSSHHQVAGAAPTPFDIRTPPIQPLLVAEPPLYAPLLGVAPLVVERLAMWIAKPPLLTLPSLPVFQVLRPVPSPLVLTLPTVVGVLPLVSFLCGFVETDSGQMPLTITASE